MEETPKKKDQAPEAAEAKAAVEEGTLASAEAESAAEKGDSDATVAAAAAEVGVEAEAEAEAEKIDVVVLPLPTNEPAASLALLQQVLGRALREEGLHLWEERFLDGLALRPIRRLLGFELSPALRAELESMEQVFGTIMDVPWFERIEPLMALVPRVDALVDGHPTAVPDFTPSAEVLLPVQSAGPNKKQAPKERQRRGRGRRNRGQNSAPERPRSPRNPAHELGDPKFTGKALLGLPGVSDQLVERLNSAGMETIQDVLLRGPESHEVIQSVSSPEGFNSDESQVVSGVLRAKWLRLSPGKKVQEAVLENEAYTLRLLWEEDAPNLPESGKRIGFVGTVTGEGDYIMSSPKVCEVDSRGVVRLPCYAIDGVSDEEFRSLVQNLLNTVLPGLRDSLPERVVRLANLPGLRQSIRELHSPTGGVGFGRSRFVFEELFLHQMQLAAKERRHRKGHAHPINHDLIGQLQIQHGIVLNDGQEKAFDEIRRDLGRPLAMNRLLQGDVGSGKALLALLSAVLVAGGRSQALFVAPNALAAEHRYLFAESLLRSVGLVPQLVTGSPSAGQLDAIKRGQSSLIFVTPEFFNPVLPEFKKLGLVVVEERDEFGKIRCEDFHQGKLAPDFLLVTPVPLPPSLSFTVFSDMNITTIHQEEGAAQSEVAAPSERDSVYQGIQEILSSGRQAYIVFPMRDGADVIDRKRGEVLAGAMAQEAFPGHKVGLFHGSMNREERSRVYEDFLHRKIDVLISTTAIEDAPEIDNAAGMMVENADHFDLIRLYRLRGHLVNRNEDSKCFFVLSKEPSESGKKLVEFVARDADPFTLAERDREIRGDEALLGERKGDLPQFRWADLSRDRKLLHKARRVVFSVLSEDPTLQRRAYRGLVEGPTRAATERAESRPETSSGNKGRRRRRSRRRGSSNKG